MIECINIEKHIEKKTILHNVNMNFEEGKIYGLFGINGSGKTMLIRAISGLLKPDEGEIVIDGKRIGKDIDFPESIGLIIENMEMLGNYDAKTNLKILSKIKNKASEEDIDEMLGKVGLGNAAGTKVRKYSLGMKQRLNIAQALFEDPKYVLLDEPFNALDDSGRAMLAELLMEEKKKGKTIIIAHHYKDELENMCDEVIEMREGELYVA